MYPSCKHSWQTTIKTPKLHVFRDTEHYPLAEVLLFLLADFFALLAYLSNLS